MSEVFEFVNRLIATCAGVWIALIIHDGIEAKKRNRR